MSTIEIDHAHRDGGEKIDAQRPRPVVELLRFKDKQLFSLRNTPVFINEDFSDKLRRKQAELVPAMKECKRGTICHHKLYLLLVRP